MGGCLEAEEQWRRTGSGVVAEEQQWGFDPEEQRRRHVAEEL